MDERTFTITIPPPRGGDAHEFGGPRRLRRHRRTCGFDPTLAALLYTAFVFAMGLLIGAGIPDAAGAAESTLLASLEPLALPDDLPGSASVAGPLTAGQSPAGDRPPSTIDLPPGEELLSADSERVIIPTRRARWGRPLNCALIGRQISFTARFSHFPEYKPDDTVPSIRIFDFTNATWHSVTSDGPAGLSPATRPDQDRASGIGASE